jgi:hypothetical protein
VPELRSSLGNGRILRSTLIAAFIAGLISHAVGYFLKPVATYEPLGLVVDLLYGFGFALWTGAVVVWFVEVIPEGQRRWIKDAVAAWDERQRRSVGARPVPSGDQSIIDK